MISKRMEELQMAKEISVLLVEPGKAPRLAKAEDTLEAFQKIVGGPVEASRPTGQTPPTAETPSSGPSCCAALMTMPISP